MASDLTHEEPVPAGIKVGRVRVARPIRPRWVAEQLRIRFCRMHHKRHPLEWRPVLRQLDNCDCAADSFGVTRRQAMVCDRNPLAGLVYGTVARGTRSGLYRAEAFQTVARRDTEAGDSAARGIDRERGIA